MTITLPPDLEAMVQERIERGPHRDAESVLRAALERYEDEERLHWLRQRLAASATSPAVEFTPELRDELYRSAKRRAATGEPLSADVWP